MLFVVVGLAACGKEPSGAPTGGSAGVEEKTAGEATKEASKPRGPVWFHDVTRQTGIDFRHNSGTSLEKPFPAANGSGVAIFDFDLDGNADLYFATGTPFPVDTSRASPTNRLYRNVAELKYVDVTPASGLGHNGYSAGLAVGDFNSDGFPDVYVACHGENCLYQNLGDGTFERVGKAAGVAHPGWATSAALFDADGDGLLDIYVCHYGQWDLASNEFCGDEAKNIRTYCSPTTIKPVPDVFFRNRGDGTFEDYTAAAGLLDRSARSQGVVAADLNNDGAIDLYLGNDLHANSCFMNDGAGVFRDVSELSGVGYDFAGTMQAGMGVDASDIDGDGLFELFVTNFRNEHNTLYKNLGKGQFQDLSHRSRLAHESLAWVGWGTVFADFDLDGWSDVVVTNGHVDDNRHLLGQDEPYKQPPIVWRNVGGTFEHLRDTAGPFFTRERVGRGLAASDLDNDGDTDLVIGHQDGAPAILRNARIGESSAQRPSFTLRLVGTRSNRDAIGSSITLRTSARVKTQQVKGGGSYLSAHDRRQVFAVKADDQDVAIEIRWPSGHVSMPILVQAGRHYVIIEPAADAETTVFTQDPNS